MRFITAAGFGIALALGIGLASAEAADLDLGPLRGTQGWNVEPVVRWQGAYFGGFAGYTTADSGYTPAPAFDHRDEITYGAFAGYNFQFEETVLGIEADVTFGEVSATTAPPSMVGFSFGNWGTLRARAGYTIGAFLPFVTAGLALVGSEIGDTVQHGLTAGAGVDVALTQNLFVRGEWQYLIVYGLEGAGQPGGDSRGDASVNTVRGAVGVKF